MELRSQNPAKKIAVMAIEAVDDAHQGQMLEDVLQYAFDQLCFRRTTSELLRLLADLRGLMDEDGDNPPRPTDAEAEEARSLLIDPDAEDCERFASRFGKRLLAIAEADSR